MPGRSILITSAPRSERRAVPAGPCWKFVKSKIRMPSSGPCAILLLSLFPTLGRRERPYPHLALLLRLRDHVCMLTRATARWRQAADRRESCSSYHRAATPAAYGHAADPYAAT